MSRLENPKNLAQRMSPHSKSNSFSSSENTGSYSNADGNPLTEDQYHKSDGSSGSTVDGALPNDVNFELESDQLLIDCSKMRPPHSSR